MIKAEICRMLSTERFISCGFRKSSTAVDIRPACMNTYFNIHTESISIAVIRQLLDPTNLSIYIWFKHYLDYSIKSHLASAADGHGKLHSTFYVFVICLCVENPTCQLI